MPGSNARSLRIPMWVALKCGSRAGLAAGPVGASGFAPRRPAAVAVHSRHVHARVRRSPATPARIRQGDRDKAYRPLPLDARRPRSRRASRRTAGARSSPPTSARAGLDGHGRPGRASLHQGLIKVAAAYVHAVRGNPAGVRKNLAGAHAATSVLARPAARPGP